MVVEKLGETERGSQGFGSTDLGPKHLNTSKEDKIRMWILYPDTRNNTFYDEKDILTHADMTKEVTMLSNTVIAVVQIQTMDQTLLDHIRTAGKDDDPWMERKRALSQMKERNEQPPRNCELEDGLIYYKNRLFILSNEELLNEIAKGCHDSKVAGHFGQEKTIELVTRNFYWERLADWINDSVPSCDVWQPNKSRRHTKYGLLEPLEVPYAAWISISVDIITQLPESQAKTQIMVVVDGFRKMAHFIGLEPNATTKDVADTFHKEVWKLHGLTSGIISDMDAKFSGEFCESLCKSLGIKRKMSMAYHPQTDGQTERTNQVLEGSLRNFVN